MLLEIEISLLPDFSTYFDILDNVSCTYFVVDKLFDLVGENFLSRWREIGGVVLLSLATYFIYLYTPHNCVLALCFLRNILDINVHRHQFEDPGWICNFLVDPDQS